MALKLDERDIYADTRSAAQDLFSRVPMRKGALTAAPLVPPAPPAAVARPAPVVPPAAQAVVATPAVPAGSAAQAVAPKKPVAPVSSGAASLFAQAFPGVSAVSRGAGQDIADAQSLPAAAGNLVRGTAALVPAIADDVIGGAGRAVAPAAGAFLSALFGRPSSADASAAQRLASGTIPKPAAPASAPAAAPAARSGAKPQGATAQAGDARTLLAGLPAPGTGYFVNNTTGRRVEFNTSPAQAASAPAAPAQAPTAVELLRSLGKTNRATANALLKAGETDQQYSGQRRINAAADRLAAESDPEKARTLASKLLAMQGKDPAARFSLARIQTGVDNQYAPIFETIPFNQQTGEYVLPPKPGAAGAAAPQSLVEGQIYADKNGNRAVFRNGKFEDI